MIDIKFKDVVDKHPEIREKEGYSPTGKPKEAEEETIKVLNRNGIPAKSNVILNKYDIDIIIPESVDYKKGFVEVERRHELKWGEGKPFPRIMRTIHVPAEKFKRLNKEEGDNVFFVSWSGDLFDCLIILGRDVIESPVILKKDCKHGDIFMDREFFDVPIEKAYFGLDNLMKVIKSYLRW